MKKVVLALIGLMSMHTFAEGDHLEALYGVNRTDDGLVIKVRSYGCTRANSFRVNYAEQGISIIRIKPDNCRRMPHIIDVELPLKKDTGAFVLLNPFAGLM